MGILSAVRSSINRYFVQSEFWGMANRQIDICLTKWYTVKGCLALHESVGETDR